MSENGATSIAAPLIRLEGISKVFLTEEIETHALSGVSLEIHDGQFSSSAGDGERRRLRERLIRPLHTVSNLLAALRAA